MLTKKRAHNIYNNKKVSCQTRRPTKAQTQFLYIICPYTHKSFKFNEYYTQFHSIIESHKSVKLSHNSVDWSI